MSRLAVLGATGLVGRQMLRLLEAPPFERLVASPADLALLGSGRAQERTLPFRGEELPVEAANAERLADADLVLSSAGSAVSRDLLPGAARAGAVCIDNTSAFRMDPGVPLVVPEVNGHRLAGIRPGAGGAIVANPNCSTIQLVVALQPLHAAARVRSVVASTYQSLSGAGREATERFRGASAALLTGEAELHDSLCGAGAFDAVPRIGELDPAGDSTEELKMIAETPKILEAPVDLDVTCVRVPVFVGHAEAVLVETEEPLSIAEASALLGRAPGVVLDDPGTFSTPRSVAGEHAVHVGRLRASRTRPNALSLWISADNLLKGAALNAVQIAAALTAPEAAPDRSPARSSA